MHLPSASDARAAIRTWSTRGWPAAQISVVAIAICAWQIGSFHGVRQDDPFITYRYGQNLVNGSGLVFNPGVRFLGATSPAHVLLAALVYAMVGKALTPFVMAVLGCLAWSAQAAAVSVLLAPVLGIFGACLVGLIVDLGGAESYRWVPFETNIAMALALFGLVAEQRGRHALAAALLGLGTLFRPEIALLAALVLGSLVVRRRGAGLRAGLVFATFVGGWAAFAFAYYGSALPHSAQEKFQRTTVGVYAEHVWAHLGEVIVPLGHGTWVSLCAWALCLAGAAIAARLDRALLLLATFTLLHLLAFTLFLRPFVEHTWHLYPGVLGGVVLVAVALAWLSGRAPKRLVRAGAALVLGGLIIATAMRGARASLELTDSYWTGERDAVYQEVAKILRGYLQQDEEFASVEVGTLSYYSERLAYDLGGLVTDLSADPMARHRVRLLVLDKRYLYTAPPWRALRVVSRGQFSAYIFEMPVRVGQERKTGPATDATPGW